MKETEVQQETQINDYNWFSKPNINERTFTPRYCLPWKELIAI